ncbi:phosphate ABC transporter permease PstA [soil metagenome]|jgi:phosphate transport system permease protein
MSQSTQAPQQDAPTPKQGNDFNPRTGKRHWTARFFKVLTFIATIIGMIVLAVLLFDIGLEGIPRLSPDFITSGGTSSPETTGIYTGLVGSLWLVALTALFAVPLGIGAAVYLEEYAKDSWLNRIVEINISNLAGVPSIVYGLLALGIFVNYLGFLTGGTSILSGAAALSLLILPVIIIASREAVRAVPGKVREGAYALGATKWDTVRGHVLPMALPGAMTGTILALSRAIGETAPLIVVGASAYLSFTPNGPRDRFSAMPIQIFEWTALPQEGWEAVAAAGIVVLLVVLLLMNSIAITIRNRTQRGG